MLDSKEKRKIWMKATEENPELLQGRVKEDIEKHRKGYCKIRFTDNDGKPICGKEVKIKQIKHDFKFGANIFMLDEFAENEYNIRYRNEFKKCFNLATVPFYWEGLEPEKGKPRYDKNSPKVWRRPAPELCMEYCEENGITPKLHCLVYDKFIPDWLPADDMAQMEAYYEERFRQISERFSGRMAEFEVINEQLQVWWWTTGSVIVKKPDILEWSFNLARKYFPNETLVINEGNYLAEIAAQGLWHRYCLLIDNALKSGVSIDKIGVQHHIYTGATAADETAYENEIRNCTDLVDPAAVLKGLDVLAGYGLPLEITEITIPTLGDTPEDEELQADLLEMLYSVWFSHPAMEGIVYWNLPDGYAFDDKSGAWNENNCRGGLFHHDLTPKKSAERLCKLVNEVWHTETELYTDKNGYVEFRGFYGEYGADIEGAEFEFGIHKNESNRIDVEI